MANAKFTISEAQLAQAERLIGEGIGWAEVPRMIGLGDMDYRVLRNRVDMGYREERRVASRDRMRKRLGVENPRDVKPPAADLARALAARDKRARAAATFVRDVTALVMGDPEPGRREMMAALDPPPRYVAESAWKRVEELAVGTVVRALPSQRITRAVPA